MIYLYTGDGSGKTTSALGVALRSLGHGKKVVVVQFMKGRKDIGEYKIQNKLKDLKVYQFGKNNFVNLKNPSKEDKELAEKGLRFIKNLKGKIDLLILDEVNLVARIGLLNVKDVLDALNKIKCDVYMTGRYAPKEFIKKADFVSVIKNIKRKDIKARKGIEY